MKQAVCSLKSASPYSQSRHYTTEKKPKENANDYERRTWRDRLHVSKDGRVFIPAMSFTNSILDAAKYLAIPTGKGSALYTKHFEAGVRVTAPLVLDVKAADVECEELFVPSNGKRGGGSRVTKYFPVIPSWSGVVTYLIADDIITKEAFHQALVASGSLIGIGRFRPVNRGYYGMFSVEKFQWMEDL